jgi:hypothetical protein
LQELTQGASGRLADGLKRLPPEGIMKEKPCARGGTKSTAPCARIHPGYIPGYYNFRAKARVSFRLYFYLCKAFDEF